MYKVFIDDKAIVFSSQLKKTQLAGDAIVILIQKKNWVDILQSRAQLPASVTLLVVSEDPEKTIRKVFKSHKWIEAAGGIVWRKKKALFIERLGRWDLPKGKIDKGERPEDAAIREIEEECGIIEPVIDKLIDITFHTYIQDGKPYIKKNWWYSLSYDGPKKLKPQTEESITKAEWLDRSEWKKVVKNTYPSIRSIIDNGRWTIDN